MKRLLSARLAGGILITSLSLLAVFHVLVLLKVIPADIVWGGQIKNSSMGLFGLELLALGLTLVFMVIIAAKINLIPSGRFHTWVNLGVWVIFIYMLLNLLGNLASSVSFENLVFAPITLVLALCTLRLAMEK